MQLILKSPVRFTKNLSHYENILSHLVKVGNYFIPVLSESVILEEYSKKLHLFAERYECWYVSELVGLLAIYNNKKDHAVAYVTNVSVDKLFGGQGIASELLYRCILDATEMKTWRIDLHVNKFNMRAIAMYGKYGFKLVDKIEDKLLMSLILDKYANK